MQSIIVIFIVLIILYILKKIFYRKKINIKIEKNLPILNIKTDDGEQEIELSDIKYYNDINSEYNRRCKWYEKISSNLIPQPDIEVVNENIETSAIEIPYNLLNHIDDQNVHDTFVQKDINNIYDRLNNKKSYSVASTYNNIDITLKEINEYANDTQIENIILKIKERNSFISNLNANEIDILNNIWNKAKHHKNDNIKRDLILQLKDCKSDKYDNLYCPTGVTSRIISSLSIENPEEMPKDKNMINQEVLYKFNKLYKKNTNKAEVKNEILKDYNSDEKISKMIDEWIDFV